MNYSTEYQYHDSQAGYSASYILPTLQKILCEFPPPLRILELGCGNGFLAHHLYQQGYEVVASDWSESGISIAQQTFQGPRYLKASAYDDLSELGHFDIVISLEVVEHLYAPREFAANISKSLNHKGVAIISTPYHSYLKNLALAATGKMDAHFTALWDNGHIKFWSRKTLRQLFAEQSLSEVSFHRVGRVPSFAKSMIGVYAFDC